MCACCPCVCCIGVCCHCACVWHVCRHCALLCACSSCSAMLSGVRACAALSRRQPARACAVVTKAVVVLKTVGQVCVICQQRPRSAAASLFPCRLAASHMPGFPRQTRCDSCESVTVSHLRSAVCTLIFMLCSRSPSVLVAALYLSCTTPH
jgi:hypothetical protein